MEFNIDLNQLVAEKAKELALEQVKSVVEKELRDYEDTLDNYVSDLVERKVDKAVEKDDFNLEEVVTNSVSKTIMLWISQNVYQDDLLQCVKDAIIIKMQEYTLDDLIKLANGLKKDVDKKMIVVYNS